MARGATIGIAHYIQEALDTCRLGAAILHRASNACQPPQAQYIVPVEWGREVFGLPAGFSRGTCVIMSL